MAVRRFHVLERLIKQNGWTRGAELGVYKGATFFHLLETCPDLHLIGVDSWLPLPATQRRDLDKGCSDPRARTPQKMADFSQTVLARAEAHPRATIYYEDTKQAADRVEDGSLDFVFIDADHSTASVLSDVRAWSPKVREGGWVMGHDVQWPSVRRALKQLFPAWTVYEDNVWSVP